MATIYVAKGKPSLKGYKARRLRVHVECKQPHEEVLGLSALSGAPRCIRCGLPIRGTAAIVQSFPLDVVAQPVVAARF